MNPDELADDDAALQPSYADRARLLLAEHAELFAARPAATHRFGVVDPPALRAVSVPGARGRRTPQLVLPLRPRLVDDAPGMMRS